MTSSIVTSIFHFGCCKETPKGWGTGTLIIHSAPLGRSRNTYLNIILDVESIQTWTWTFHFGCQSQSFRYYRCHFFLAIPDHGFVTSVNILYIYIYHPSICWAVDKYIVLNINTCGAKVNSISIQTPAPKEHTSYAMSRSSWHWLNNEQSNMLCPRGGFKHVLVT